MTHFHGSCVTVAQPDVKRGRGRVDFGQGFYLTRLREQAVAWARSVARRYRGGVAILNSFDFDVEKAHTLADDRYKVFESYDMEWLDYVAVLLRGDIFIAVDLRGGRHLGKRRTYSENARSYREAASSSQLTYAFVWSVCVWGSDNVKTLHCEAGWLTYRTTFLTGLTDLHDFRAYGSRE